MRLVRLSALIPCFLSTSSWGNYNGFPMEDSRVTGTFMEYRPPGDEVEAHFHGGVDFI